MSGPAFAPRAAGFPLGLTGAVAPTRYVGGTVAGAPTTGTFAVRDFIVDGNGTVWVCTVAGTPGTWVATGPGVELGYVEQTSQALLARSGSDVTQAVAGMSITVTVGARPIMVRAGSSFMQYTAAGGACRASIIQGGVTEVARQQFFIPAGGTASQSVPWSAGRRLSLTAGSYTFNLQIGALFVNGTAVLDGQTFQPLWLQAIQV